MLRRWRNQSRLSLRGPRRSTEYSRRIETAAALEEAELIRALRGREEAAFVELARTYHSGMLRVAQIYVSSRAVAEEVVQETWIGVLRGIDRFEGLEPLPWVADQLV